MSPIGNGLSGDLIILDYVRLSRDMIHRICCGVITVWAVRDGFRRRMERFVECAERTKWGKGNNQCGCTCARDVAKGGGLTMYRLFGHAPAHSRGLSTSTWIFAAFIGLDSISFRVLVFGLYTYTFSRYHCFVLYTLFLVWSQRCSIYSPTISSHYVLSYVCPFCCFYTFILRIYPASLVITVVGL